MRRDVGVQHGKSKVTLEHAQSVSGEPVALFFIKTIEDVREASHYSHIIRLIIVERYDAANILQRK